MKLIVLGSNGMLGSYLTSYLSQRYETLNLNRSDIDLSRNEADIKKYLLNRLSEGDVLINAAGVTKHREYNIKDMIFVNGVLPHILGELKQQINCEVVHITTDCVYSGASGNYDENSRHDANDDYGKSKSLGESPLNTNIRTSIIGEDIRNNRSLIEWVKSNSGKKINGYTNHMWNGVTCLQLAKFIDVMISKHYFWSDVRHIFSPDALSKYELVQIINEVYNLGIVIEPIETREHCYRTLVSLYEDTTSIDKNIKTQIIEQKVYREI